MIRLLLDGYEAIIKKNSSFKFTRENQLLSEQGDYSMQITLPIEGCATNKRIFGNINLIGSRQKKDGKYTLQTDIISNSGKYRVTEINETEIKIQLMAKKTRANFDFKDKNGKEIYIDDLDLGFFYDEWNWNDHALTEDWPSYIKFPPEQIFDYRNFVNQLPGMSQWTHEDGLKRGIDGYNCVLFATKSTIDDKVVNFDSYTESVETIIWEKRGSFCFQPTIVDVIKRIFEKGFNIQFKNELNYLKSHVYIASMREEYKIAKMLPHWTVNEFLKEVCNFFNAALKYEDNKVTLLDKEKFYSQEIQQIDKVIDEYSIQLNEEDREQFSYTGNVDYEWDEEDAMLRLPDEVWEKAKIKHCYGLNEIDEFIFDLGEDASKSQYVFVQDSNDNKYAILEDNSDKIFKRTRVDWFSPLLRNQKSRDIQTSLRIIPIRIYRDGEGWIMGMNESIANGGEFSVNNAIKPNAEVTNEHTEDKRDVLEVFYWDGRTRPSVNCPIGVMVTTSETTGLPEYIEFTNYGHEILDPRGPFPLDIWLQNEYSGLRIKDTRTEYQFSFIKKGPIDIDKPFLINGMKYICRKLEYDCDDEGIKPIIQGYFYRI